MNPFHFILHLFDSKLNLAGAPTLLLYWFLVLLAMIFMTGWSVNRYRFMDHQGPEVYEQAMNGSMALSEQLAVARMSLRDLDDRARHLFGLEHQWPPIGELPQQFLLDYFQAFAAAGTPVEARQAKFKKRLLRYERLSRLRNRMYNSRTVELAKIIAILDDNPDDMRPSETALIREAFVGEIRDLFLDLEEAQGELEQLGGEYFLATNPSTPLPERRVAKSRPLPVMGFAVSMIGFIAFAVFGGYLTRLYFLKQSPTAITSEPPQSSLAR